MSSKSKVPTSRFLINQVSIPTLISQLRGLIETARWQAFFQGFPIWNAVLTKLSWTHYCNILRVEDKQARNWYMEETATQIAPLQNHWHYTRLNEQTYKAALKELGY